MADRVTFTPGSAERIAKVVRIVEAGNRDTGWRPPAPRAASASSGKVFRICTFDGDWPIGSAKSVTFKNQTSTPNTASATNLFFPITDAGSTIDCAIAKDGTGWYLIDVPFETATIAISEVTATGFFASVTASALVVQSTAQITFFPAGSTATQSVVTDISLGATLDTNDCAITVSKTLSTQSITLVTVGGTQTALVVSATATNVSISSAATAIFATQTATTSVLRLKVT